MVQHQPNDEPKAGYGNAGRNCTGIEGRYEHDYRSGAGNGWHRDWTPTEGNAVRSNRCRLPDSQDDDGRIDGKEDHIDGHVRRGGDHFEVADGDERCRDGNDRRYGCSVTVDLGEKWWKRARLGHAKTDSRGSGSSQECGVGGGNQSKPGA